jgi:DNA polymerase III subunit epsilon
MRQIVLDTETTGLETSKGHRIIEIAAVEMINRKLTGHHFHRYINPEREIDAGALSVHGITADFLKDKPLFAQIAEEFMIFVKSAELIIHNAPFDIGFINYELHLFNKPSEKITDHCQIIDTLSMAKMRHPGQKNNLDALCKRYNIDNTQRNLHGALLDANLLAQVYLAMTGGQGSLFGDESQAYKPQQQKTKKRNHSALLVIKATPEEERLHTQRLSEVEEIARHS